MGKAKRPRRVVNRPRKALKTWRSMIDMISEMNETELKKALDMEAAKPRAERRHDVIHRLHRRFSTLRQERELQELLH